MENRFNKVIEELMSTTDVGIGGTQEEPNVNPTNDDFYARGDARIPKGAGCGCKKKKCDCGKKKNKKGCGCGKKSIKESTEEVFHNPLEPHESFKILKNKFPNRKFKRVTSARFPDNRFSLRAQIFTDVFNKTRKENPDIKIDRSSFDIKKIMKSLEPHKGSNKILVVGSYVENDELGVTWVLV